MNRKIYFTKHFHDRLLERRGIVLSGLELSKISEGINRELNGVKPLDVEKFHVKLNHRKEDFLIVYSPKNSTVVTAIIKSRMGYKKFREKFKGKSNA